MTEKAPQEKQLSAPTILFYGEIGPDGRLSFEVTDGVHIFNEDERFGFRVGIAMHMLDKINTLWYSAKRENGGAK